MAEETIRGLLVGSGSSQEEPGVIMRVPEMAPEGRRAVNELCAFWPCGSCVIFVGLFVGFRWTSVANQHLVGNGGP